MGQKKLKIFYSAGLAASAILLTVIQLPFGISALAWIALVPFVIASLAEPKSKFVYIAAFIISFFYWLANLYWLGLVTTAGWILFCLYMAIYWPILIAALRYCNEKKVPLWFCLPILIVGTEAFAGWIFKGFAWRYLAHSQYDNLLIIQIADIFGAAAVSFLIAMVNGLIVDFVIGLKKKQLFSKANIVGLIVVAMAFSATIFYGRARLLQTADYLCSGPTVAVAQSNVIVESGEEIEPADITFIDLLAQSRASLLAGPDLIVWPETMVEAVLDDSYLKIAPEGGLTRIFHNALTRHSKDDSVNLLVGAFAGDAELVDDIAKMKTKYNSAFLYEPNQVLPRQHYNKIHLVPFGEYIPFKESLPFLYKFMMAISPYDYDYTVDAGNEFTVFEMTAGKKKYRFAAMICFEDTNPTIARKFTLGPNKSKQIDFFVNISNDGWFVSRKDGKDTATSELSQRMAISVFRAIENRTPIIRSVNSGISCYIDSTGKIHDSFLAGTLNKKAAQRTCQVGWFADKVMTDKRVTIFSHVGRRLEISCAICLTFAVFMSIYKNRA